MNAAREQKIAPKCSDFLIYIKAIFSWLMEISRLPSNS